MTDTTSLSHLERHVVRTRGKQTALRVPLDGVHLVLKHEKATFYEKVSTSYEVLFLKKKKKLSNTTGTCPSYKLHTFINFQVISFLRYSLYNALTFRP